MESDYGMAYDHVWDDWTCAWHNGEFWALEPYRCPADDAVICDDCRPEHDAECEALKEMVEA